jgi:glycosyltransferase involved in cell wall biosynthesis
MHKPSVSVVIPTYNAARFLVEALESALSQTLPPDDIVVVDDGSTDDTEDTIYPYRRRIQYIRQENQGPAVARNCGIAHSKGDLVAFLDADDVWLPEKLEIQVNEMRAHPRIGLVHTNYVRLDSAGVRHPTRTKSGSRCAGRCYLELFKGCGVKIATVLVRKECLTKVGGFDESFRHASCEDYDLWIRMARHFEYLYIDSPLVLYRDHPTSASKNDLMMLEQELYVIRKSLAADTELKARIGTHQVRGRLFDLYHGIGYAHHDGGRSAEARHFFSQALHQNWAAPYTWLLYIGNMLHPRHMCALRSIKRSIAHVGKCRTGDPELR